MSSVDDLVVAAKRFLKDTWNEDTVSMIITKNEVVDGNGKLHTDCVVKLGGVNIQMAQSFHFQKRKSSRREIPSALETDTNRLNLYFPAKRFQR